MAQVEEKVEIIPGHQYYPLNLSGRLYASCTCHWMQSLAWPEETFHQSAPPPEWPPVGIDGQRKRRAR